MKIYCVIEAINQTMSPSIETAYHLTLDEGEKDFGIRVSSVYDYVSIYLEELDTESMNVVILDSFEGNEASFEEDEDEDEDEESDDE